MKMKLIGLTLLIAVTIIIVALLSAWLIIKYQLPLGTPFIISGVLIVSYTLAAHILIKE